MAEQPDKKLTENDAPEGETDDESHDGSTESHKDDGPQQESTSVKEEPKDEDDSVDDDDGDDDDDNFDGDDDYVVRTPLSSISRKAGSVTSLEKFYELELQRMGLVDIEIFQVLKRKHALQQRLKLKETDVR